MIQRTPYFWKFLKFSIIFLLPYSKESLLCNHFFISLKNSDFYIATIQDLGEFRMPKICWFCGRWHFLNKIKFYLQEFGLASWIWVKKFLVFKSLQEKALALSGSVIGTLFLHGDLHWKKKSSHIDLNFVMGGRQWYKKMLCQFSQHLM